MTVGDTLGNVKALVDTLADTLPEMEELSVGEIRRGAQALVDALGDTLADAETVTPGDILGDAHALNDLLCASWRHTGQCAGSDGHASQHCTKDGGVVSRRHGAVRRHWSTHFLTRSQSWRR